MKKSLWIFLLISMSYNGLAQKYAIVEQKPVFDGNDIISYYDGEILKGKKDFQTQYDGLTLYFSSQKNLERFTADPDGYMPEFGGWCATAMSMDTRLVPNYNFYKIENENLLFFAVQAFINARTLWERDTVENFKNAVINYDKLLKNAPENN